MIVTVANPGFCEGGVGLQKNVRDFADVKEVKGPEALTF